MVLFLRHWANRYIGIPFKEKGRNHEGCDCWGLVRLVSKEQFHIELPDHDEDYKRIKDRDVIAESIDKDLPNWDEIEKPQGGDIVLLKCLGLPTHIGIMIDKKHMLHVMKRTNASIERLDSVIWRDRVLGYYRYKQVYHAS